MALEAGRISDSRGLAVRTSQICFGFFLLRLFFREDIVKPVFKHRRDQWKLTFMHLTYCGNPPPQSPKVVSGYQNLNVTFSCFIYCCPWAPPTRQVKRLMLTSFVYYVFLVPWQILWVGCQVERRKYFVKTSKSSFHRILMLLKISTLFLRYAETTKVSELTLKHI